MLFPSLFTIIVGFGMIGMWSATYFRGQIPELETEPIRIRYHLAAEFTTALLLICTGMALITNQSWATPAYLVAMGMLFYTVIVSPGYFAQKGQWVYVVMFGVILVLAIISLVWVLIA